MIKNDCFFRNFKLLEQKKAVFDVIYSLLILPCFLNEDNFHKSFS
jgi:hypothetical protein